MMPPAKRSQTSVKVTSSTAWISPESTSFSMARPPVPVAWKTRQSKRPSSAARARCTQGVVTPNMVMPRAGRLATAGIAPAARTMPASACAALASTRRLMRFRPATSVTECSIAMSLGPT